MTVEERIGAADRRKMDGNDLFKEEKLEEAMQQYEMVIKFCFFNIPDLVCFLCLYAYCIHLSLIYSFFSLFGNTIGHCIHGR